MKLKLWLVTEEAQEGFLDYGNHTVVEGQTLDYRNYYSDEADASSEHKSFVAFLRALGHEVIEVNAPLDPDFGT